MKCLLNFFKKKETPEQQEEREILKAVVIPTYINDDKIDKNTIDRIVQSKVRSQSRGFELTKKAWEQIEAERAKKKK